MGTVMYFGEPWDAPMLADATRLPETPWWAECLRCHEPFQDGDRGVVTPLLTDGLSGPVDPRFMVGVFRAGTLVAHHRECLLASTVGHTVGVCACTGYGTDRAAAQEVLRRFEEMTEQCRE